MAAAGASQYCKRRRITITADGLVEDDDDQDIKDELGSIAAQTAVNSDGTRDFDSHNSDVVDLQARLQSLGFRNPVVAGPEEEAARESELKVQ